MAERKQKILVTRLRGQVMTAIWEEERVVEWIPEDENPGACVGDIFLAQVRNIVRNVNAVFLELRPGVPCFLPLADGEKRPGIGEIFPVVITREGTPLKAPRASRELTFTGRYLVLVTDRNQTTVSSKIRSEDRRETLKNLIRPLSEEYHVGFILRTNAEQAADNDILHEAEAQLRLLSSIREKAACRPPFTLLHAGGRAYESVIRDHPEGVFTEVVTDQHDIYEELSRMPVFASDPVLTLRFYDDRYPLYKCYRLEHHLQVATERRVWLKSGGFLIFDYTEALTVIDVNSGKYDGHKGKEETFLLINREACMEIGRQLRLRNLSGIILVDFIDMSSASFRNEIECLLRRILAEDPQKAVLVDITGLNLAEITRKKVRRPLRLALKDIKKDLDSP